jgi:NAD(P)-dependent dehydrogenase (short-subunit alcohol dehydrogenase family)
MHATALITGGNGGLGAAVLDAFADEGWRVVAPVRQGRMPDDPRRRDVEFVEADLFEADDARAAVDAAAGRSDAPLRAVVNLVGGYSGGAGIADAPVEAFEAQLRLNLRPAYLVIAAAMPRLRDAAPAAIVCVSSRAALRPFAGAAGYIASKAAVIALAGAVAAEGAPGVRCNTVLPSVIDTPANRRSQPDADTSGWVSPEQIAGVIRFLAGPASAPMSGAAVPVYGP